MLMKRASRVAPPKAGKERTGAKVLYITYDGLTDPLGRSQILPYLIGLSRLGHQITVLSCEKPARLDQDGPRIAQMCVEAGLNWHPLKYHKRPPILSSAFDTAMMQRAAVRINSREGFDLTHCRSYISARVGLALRPVGVRLLFDMRGFWPEEKVEGASWDLGNPLYAAVYRYFKWLESRLLHAADCIVSLTQAGKEQLLTRIELQSRKTLVSVIPCSVDVDHFPLVTVSGRRDARLKLGIPQTGKVLGYLGSLGTWYMLDEMLDFFKVYATRHEQAHFLFLTPDDPGTIRAAAASRGIGPGQLTIRFASREEVPKMMAAADLGIFFIKPVGSKVASSPTKMAEMLALGLPIVTNEGIGDVGSMVREMGLGVVVDDFTAKSFDRAASQLDSIGAAPEKMRDAAVRLFALNLAIERYDRIYRSLSIEKPMLSNTESKRARNSVLE